MNNVYNCENANRVHGMDKCDVNECACFRCAIYGMRPMLCYVCTQSVGVHWLSLAPCIWHLYLVIFYAELSNRYKN